MLGALQQRLQATFQTLAESRRPLGYPVYALEHGLVADEVEQGWAAASDALRYGAPSPTHWLVWCALAAEAGYQYSGDEFWPEMERRRGEWRTNEYRQCLRAFYRRFCSDFGGFEPKGRWAGHFNIIAWPISGAILPKYLQAHFAQHLFDLKFELPRALQSPGEELGQLLLERYTGPSSRFRDFLQQTGLTTQIVLALRDETRGAAVNRIEPKVLRKIVADLERKREARFYLRDARRVIDATSIKVATRLQPKSDSQRTSTQVPAHAPARFTLVARKQSDGQFALGLRLPDFRAIGLTREAMADQRVKFAGTDEQFQPASVLLALSKSERRLDDFPEPNAGVIVAEQEGSDLAVLLDTVARIEERPTWILRRQLGGGFHEVSGGHIRTRQDYLILSRGNPPDALLARAGLRRVRVRASGVEAFGTTTPAILTDDARSALKALGIGVTGGVTVAPAGLNPRPGATPSWLTTERVTLSLAADFEVQGFALSLDGGAAEILTCHGSVALLDLGQLEPGRHSLAVSPVFSSNSDRVVQSEQFEFAVEEPRPWPEVMKGKSGFRLVLEPPGATFEMVLGGIAALDVLGPARRSVRWSLVTYDAAGHPGSPLPLGNSQVGDAPANRSEAFRNACRKHSDQIDEAFQIDIVASLEELGRQSKRFPHIVEPLRWKYEPAKRSVRLVDETDHEELPKLSSYRLSSPIEKCPLTLESALAGITPDGEGTLLVARYKDLFQSVVVRATVTTKLKDLASLGTQQSIVLPPHKGQAVMRLIDGMRRWERAKPLGDFALMRRDMTVNRLQHELTALCCEREFADLLSSSPPALDRAQLKVGGSQGFGLRMHRSEWPSDYESAVELFVYYARLYEVERSERRARAALTLAYRPLKFKLEGLNDGKEFIADLIGRRSLMRGAFLARAASQSRTAKVGAGD